MREENPGDLSVRLGFGRMMGTGPDAGGIRPRLEIQDGTSGSTLTIELTAADLAEMLAGGAAFVTADKVTGFKGLSRWGKFMKLKTVHVPTEGGDYAVRGPEAVRLPGVAKAIAELEAEGYTCDTPSRNNAAKWVIHGRRYDADR